jgi:hypothetical protein
MLEIEIPFPFPENLYLSKKQKPNLPHLFALSLLLEIFIGCTSFGNSLATQSSNV